jgi:hypothetical protein
MAVTLTVLIHIFSCGVVVFLGAINVDTLDGRQHCDTLTGQSINDVGAFNF